MSESRHLEKSPIVEAIIKADFFTNDEKPLELDDELQEKLLAKMKGYLGKINPIQSFGFQFDSLKKEQKMLPQTNVGFEGIKQENDTIVFKIYDNSVSVHKLKPYTTGDDLFNDFMYVVKEYINITNADKIKILSTRNINQFDCKEEALSKRLNLYPTLVKTERQLGISSAMTKVIVKPNDDDKINGMITIAINPAKEHDHIKVIVDIDVVIKEIFEAKEKLIKERWEKIRSFKNDLFFSSVITEGYFK